MRDFIFTKKQKTNGNVMIITTMLFVAITLSISLGLVLPVIGAYTNAKAATKTKISYALAESGVEDMYYRLSNNKNIASSSTLVLGSATATTTVTDISSTQKQIKSIGVLANLNRISSATVAKAAQVTLPYGGIIGTGGLSMLYSASINGGVYSNGPITSGYNSYISESAISTVSIRGVDQYNKVSVGNAGTYNAWAPTMSAVQASGSLYCNTGTGNDKACNTTLGTPPPIPMPVADTLITQWKNDAAKTVINGNVNYAGTDATVVIGSRKIIGNLFIDNGYKVRLTGPIWITGNLIMGNSTLTVDTSYAGGSIPIIVDGLVNIQSGATIGGSGVVGSYAVIVSTSDCPAGPSCGGQNAVYQQGGGGSTVIIAQNGTVSISNGNTAKQVTAKRLELSGGMTMNYDTNLSTLTFSSTGGWGVMSWQETAN